MTVESKFPSFRPGDTVKVHVRVKEGEKSRIQAYEGVVTALRGAGVSRTFTVRKISYGVGVERVFPFSAPVVEKIDVLRAGKVRRNRLTYLRDRRGKAARLKERRSEA